MFGIIDFGNTNIKVGIFQNDKCVEVKVFNNTADIESFIEYLKSINLIKIYYGSSNPKKTSNFISKITKFADFKLFYIKMSDFANVLDLSAYKSEPISTDILAIALYIQKKFNIGLGFSMGTAYFSVAVNKSYILGATIAPNVRRSLEPLINTTELLNNVPLHFLKELGNNTIDCISSGARCMAEGYVCKQVEYIKNLLPNIKDVIITGGDMHDVKFIKYNNVNFHFIENAVIFGYKLLIELEGL